MFRKKSTKDLVHSNKAQNPSEATDAFDIEEDDQGKRKRRKNRKPKQTRSGKTNFFRTRYFIGIVCILLAASISFGAIPVLRSQTSNLVTVLVFKQNAAYGEQVSEDMLKTVEMSNYNLPLGVQTEVSAVVGSYITADIVAGDIVTSGRLRNTYPGDDPQLVNLPEGKVAVAVSLSGLSQSLSAKLRPGDVVQIYAMMSNDLNGGRDSSAAAPIELQYIEVLSVSDNSGYDVNTATGNTIDTVILIANAQQAVKLVSLEHTAALHAVLVTRGNEELKRASLDLQEQLFLELELELEEASNASEEEMEMQNPELNLPENVEEGE